MSYSSEVLADAPAVYLKLDETTTGTTTADASGNNRPFTVVNATAGAAKVMPNGVAAYDFNGTNAYLERLHETWMDSVLTDFTVEAWFRADTIDSSAYRTIFSHDSYSGGNWTLFVKGGALVYFTGTSTLLTGPAVSVGTDYHVALVFDAYGSGASGGYDVYLYLNGTQAAFWHSAGSSVTTSNSMRVGSSHGTNDGDSYKYQFFDGRIDEFAYYTTALSATRIKAHYDAGMVSPGTTVAGESFVVTDTALDGSAKTAVWVAGEPFAVTDTALDGHTNLDIKVAGQPFAVTDTAGEGFVVGSQIIVSGQAFVVTDTALDGTPPVVAQDVAASVDTFNRANGRKRTGISYATVTYAPVTPPPHIVPVPVRIMAQQIGAA